MGGRKVVIIDEADYLNPNSTQPAMRGAIEEFASNCSFIFTCNFKNRIIDPIHSRCSVIDFKVNGSKQKMAADFFKRVEWILEQENITYDKKVVAAVITKHFPDNRRVINELQRYSVSGTIDAGILSNIADIQLESLTTSLKEKDFASVRKWVTNNLDNDPVKIYRKLYDTLYEALKANTVPQLVLILAKYQYQSAFVADHEINMVACLTEIMVECEFK
jgi:DNA polymerase III delta prime subunit